MGAIISKIQAKSKSKKMNADKRSEATSTDPTYKFRPVTKEERERLRVDVYNYIL